MSGREAAARLGAYEQRAAPKEDVGPCWICLDDEEAGAVLLGCGCQRAAHMLCAARWFVPRAEQYAFRPRPDAAWELYATCVCEVCRRKLDAEASELLLRLYTLSTAHPARPTVWRRTRDCLLAAAARLDWGVFIMFVMVAFEMWLFSAVFTAVPQLCADTVRLVPLQRLFCRRGGGPAAQ